MIRLFPAGATTFTTLGYGVLNCVSCVVTEELNDEYELEAEYSVEEKLYSTLALRQIIVTKPNPTDDEQPFRIYKISRPIDGVVTIYAQHISYDLTGIPVMPFTVNTPYDAFTKFIEEAAVTNPFTFVTNVEEEAEFKVESPSTCKSLMSKSDKMLLGLYGGEYKYDKWTVNHLTRRGSDTGVTIRYGKNLKDLKQDEECTEVYNGVLAYWKKDTTIIKGDIQYAEGTFAFNRIYLLDCSNDFESQPTKEQLEEAAQNYIEENDVGVPKVSLDVEYVQLEQSEEYKGYALLNTVALGDTVKVLFPEMGVNATARVNKVEYDAVLGRVEKISLGDTEQTVAKTISESKVVNGTIGNVVVIGKDGIITDGGSSPAGDVEAHNSSSSAHSTLFSQKVGLKTYDITIGVAEWSGTTAVKSVTGLITTSKDIIVPLNGYKDIMDSCCVEGEVTAANTLTLTCGTTPTEELKIRLFQFK